MAKTKSDIEIGKRAFEEVLRIFPKMKEAREYLGISGNLLLYDWMNGGCPSAKYFQRLYYCGADITYILTGVRSK